MIFRLIKGLHKETDDFIIYPENKSFFIKAAKFIKGFYLYNKEGEQIGQIVFNKSRATISAPDSASLTIVRNIDKSFAIIETQFDEADKKSIKNKDAHKKLTTEFMVYGNTGKYNYDIYQKSPENKRPFVVASVINDIIDGRFYKVKVDKQANILKIIMLCMAIDKLNLDPESKY